MIWASCAAAGSTGIYLPNVGSDWFTPNVCGSVMLDGQGPASPQSDRFQPEAQLGRALTVPPASSVQESTDDDTL